MIADADCWVAPTVDAVTETLDATLNTTRPPTDPIDHAQRDDWDAIAEQAEAVSRRAIEGE